MNSRRLRETSTLRLVTPVRLPPGRDRLLTMPSATGSPPISKTIGIVAVADFAANATSAPPGATITRHLTVGQLLRQRRQPAVLTVGPSKLDRDRAPLDVTGFRQALAEGIEATAVAFRGFAAEIADDRQGLRAGRDDRCRRTTGEGDEITPPHSISGFGKGVRHETQGRLPPANIAQSSTAVCSAGECSTAKARVRGTEPVHRLTDGDPRRRGSTD